MADFTISISDSITAYGASPSTKWGSGTGYTSRWGVSRWGDGTDSVIKDFAASPIDCGGISLSSETTSEGLAQGMWNYVFVAPNTDAERRNITSFTSG